MIAGLVEILLFQGLGEVLSRFLVPLIPGPVIGLVLLLGWLQIRPQVPTAVEGVATTLTQHLGLLFVPAAVGVVTFWPHLQSNALPILGALGGSLVLTIVVTAGVLLLLAGRGQHER